MQHATISIPVPTIEQATAAVSTVDHLALTVGADRLITLGVLGFGGICVIALATVAVIALKRRGDE